MKSYKVVFAAVIFTFVNSLQANTNNDIEIENPFKKTKTVATCCIISINEIDVIEIEEEIELGFNPYTYLPADFNPFKGIKLDLDDIEVIEEEPVIDLGFDVYHYLPENFDPHSCERQCSVL